LPIARKAPIHLPTTPITNPLQRRGTNAIVEPPCHGLLACGVDQDANRKTLPSSVAYIEQYVASEQYDASDAVEKVGEKRKTAELQLCRRSTHQHGLPNTHALASSSTGYKSGPCALPTKSSQKMVGYAYPSGVLHWVPSTPHAQVNLVQPNAGDTNCLSLPHSSLPPMWYGRPVPRETRVHSVPSALQTLDRV